MARELETDGEHNKLVVYDLGRLTHALEADTRFTYVSYETRRRARTVNGRTEEIEEQVEIGRLEPKVLKKLKAKAIYSLRGEMEMVGEVDTADYIIFDSKRMDGDLV